MSAEHFFVPPAEMTSKEPRQLEGIRVDSPEKRWIIHAMAAAYAADQLQEDQNLGANSVDIGYGTQFNEFSKVELDEINFLITQFRANPVVAHALMRVKFIELLRHEETLPEDKYDLLHIYLVAYFDLITRLDRSAFPATSRTTIFQGMPEYLPDGFSDLDYIPEIDEDKRDFEKMRVDKLSYYSITFEHIKGMLMNAAEMDFSANSYRAIMFLVQSFMMFTNTSLPYDYQRYAVRDGGRSVLFHTYRYATEAVAVCRQHAIDAQLGFQAFGVRAGLHKSYIDGGSHVNNILRTEVGWSIIDVTNPEIDPILKVTRPFIVSITPPEHPNQRWNVPRITVNREGRLQSKGTEYATRRPTYYRILDNKVDSVT